MGYNFPQTKRLKSHADFTVDAGSRPIGLAVGTGWAAALRVFLAPHAGGLCLAGGWAGPCSMVFFIAVDRAADGRRRAWRALEKGAKAATNASWGVCTLGHEFFGMS